jgi:hypothetical protein
MRRLAIVSLVALAVLSALSPARGQNLEAFDVETIVDPLALKLEKDGGDVWLDFFGTYVQAGYSEDFQAATRFSKTGVTFVDWLSTYVHRNLQVSGRVTGFRESVSGISGPLRLELVAGRYFGVDGDATADSSQKDLDSEPIERLQFSIVHDLGHDAVDRSTLNLVYELMAPGVTTSPGLFRPPFDTIVRWRLAYVESARYRPPTRPGRETPAWIELPEEYQLSLEARSRTAPGWVGLTFDGGLGLGARYSRGGTRLATARMECRIERRVLQDRLRIIGVYAPAYQFDSSLGDDRWNHELTFYLHLPVLTRAFR